MFVDGCYVPNDQESYSKYQVQAKAAEASDEFVTPTQCAMPDCEVTFTFGEEERKLYVCKHTLVNLSEYFKNLLLGNFRERNSNQIHFEDIAYSDMLLFLRCAVQTDPPRPIPYDLASLSALNALADRFLMPSICKKILDEHFGFGILVPRADIKSLCHMISLPGLFCGGLEKAMMEYFDSYSLFEKSIEDKLALLEAADKHRDSGTDILEKCIRLCANLQMSDVSAFHGKVSGGTVAAVYATIDKALPKLANSPDHFCYINRKKRSYRPYDHICVVDSRKKWGCRQCDSSENVNVNLALAQDIEIDKKLIMDK